MPRYFLRLTGRSQKGIGASGGSAPPASRPFPGRAGAAHPVEPAEPLWPPGARSPPDRPRDGLPRPPPRLGADDREPPPDGAPPDASGARARPAHPPEDRIGPGCQRGRVAAPDQGPPDRPPLAWPPFPPPEPFPPPNPVPPPEPLRPRLGAGRPPKAGGEEGGAGDGAGPAGPAGLRGGRPPADRPADGHHDPPERDAVGLLPPAGGPADEGRPADAAACLPPGPPGPLGRPGPAGRPAGAAARPGVFVTRTAEPGRGGASPLRTTAPAWALVRAQPDPLPACSPPPVRGGNCNGGAERRPPSSPFGQRRARSAVAGRTPGPP